MNSELIQLSWPFLGGVLLGILFFGGLWYTVRKAVSSKSPASWILTSFLLRTGIILSGFYLLAEGSWQRILAALLGFVTGRFVFIYFTRTAGGKASALKKSDSHEN